MWEWVLGKQDMNERTGLATGQSQIKGLFPL